MHSFIQSTEFKLVTETRKTLAGAVKESIVLQTIAAVDASIDRLCRMWVVGA